MKIVAACSLKIGRGQGEVSWHFWAVHTLTKTWVDRFIGFFTTPPFPSFKEFFIIMPWKEGGGWSRGRTRRVQGPTWPLIEPDACKAKKFVLEAWHPFNNCHVWRSGFSNNWRTHSSRHDNWLLTEGSTVIITVEPSVSNHPKCKDLVAVYGRWLLTRIEPQGTSSENKSRHIYLMEDNLLPAISKLHHV